MSRPCACALALGLWLIASAIGCESHAEADAPAARDDRDDHLLASGVPDDAPLPHFQIGLLDLAFEICSAIPAQPHIKDRSAAQESVVAACLALDQPRRARDLIERIEDWHRGVAYADLAFHCARHGAPEEALRLVQVAADIADVNEDWRRDRIRVRIARTLAWLGDADQAALYEHGVAASEAGQVDAVLAMRLDERNFDEFMRSLDAIIATGEFEPVRHALEACVQLYNRFYDDADRRSLILDKIRSSWNVLPVIIRLDLMAALIEVARARGDRQTALALADAAHEHMENYTWDAEYEVPLLARIARLRGSAGDHERARRDADRALAAYEAGRDTIMMIFRPEALLPVAEAYHALGDRDAALEVYRRVIEESVVTANSRPRAQDLAAACLSMAAHGFEPDDELWRLLRRHREELGDPW